MNNFLLKYNNSLYALYALYFLSIIIAVISNWGIKDSIVFIGGIYFIVLVIYIVIYIFILFEFASGYFSAKDLSDYKIILKISLKIGIATIPVFLFDNNFANLLYKLREYIG